MEGPPEIVLAEYGLEGASLARISVGWINRTYLVEHPRGRFVLQKLHPVFAPTVHLDIDRITRHLAHEGLETPLLVPTARGDLWVDADGTWRLLSFVEGEIHDRFDAGRAYASAMLVARFHRALAGLEHTFAFTRPGAHDTAAHLAKLRASAAAAPSAAAEALARSILAAAAELPSLPALPRRIVHGDLKATNILFRGDLAVALVDLDTLAHGTLAVELGDALRSWGNTTSESDPEAVFDASIFEAAMRGYASIGRAFVTDDEARSIVLGVETIAIELAARFATDAIEDRYFGWDATRFASRVEHNLARGQSQLHLSLSVRAQRPALDAAVLRAFARG